ncbi:cellobiose dehydrogenase [Paramyrothecium foliicola]|nr:cellobiose dehydrogenase [Paramyrothecium foliicola]
MPSWTNPQETVRLGFTFPPNAATVAATEFIGILDCQGTGWCAISLGGSMRNAPIAIAYPSGNEVLTSLKWAPAYENPDNYLANARISVIASSVTATSFRVIYKCENCLAWDYQGITGSNPTNDDDGMFLSWAYASTAPANPSCIDTAVFAQHDYFGLFGTDLQASGLNAQYSTWSALPNRVVKGSCGTQTSSAVPSSTAPPEGTGIPVPTGASYDYIVVGSGAGGIPIADKLSESGKKVLLIEKGPPSTGRWQGKMKPTWLEGTSLTRFDVPGLCNQIWKDAGGISCRDTDQMAGCVLGGGTAVNAGLWWRPNPVDWDYNFPSGWKASDVQAATSRVFSRIGGTTVPSQDGKTYYQQGFNMLSNGLKAGGWTSANLNNVPAQKNRTYGPGPFMFSGGERGGPLATYLVSADNRNNFDLWTNTQVKRVIRQGGHITGVEVENYAGNGYKGTVNVTPVSGRVILSAGTFGSAKILLRSGIGPKDQLDNVKNSTDGPTMVAEQSWIKLPVGYNLEDHTNTDIIISHPDVVHYDFYQSWATPIEADKTAYLSKRSGILAQAAPNIGPLFFDEVRGADNIVRSIQYTARVEGNDALGIPDGSMCPLIVLHNEQIADRVTEAMVISQYLGRGAVSRGRMTISTALNTVVATHPYLRNDNDREAIIKSLETLQNTLKNVKNLKFEYPAAGISMREHVEKMQVDPSNRRANHWIGTNKMGTKDGRKSGGDSVVDLNTKVYGTDNLFVVDASIFPGMVTTNPSAYIVVASEHAATKILALPTAKTVAKYGQCGGVEYNGNFQCASGSSCQYQNDYYWQCLLAARLDSGIALCAKHDSRADPAQHLRLASLQTRLEDIELTKRRLEHLRLALLATVEWFGQEHTLLRPMRCEREHGAEIGGTVALRLGAESCVEHVVGPRHALNDVTGNVSVDAIGGNIDRLAGLKDQVVHCQQRDNNAGSRCKLGNILIRASEGRGRKGRQIIVGALKNLVRGLKNVLHGPTEIIVAELGTCCAGGQEMLELVELEKRFNIFNVLEAAEGFEFGQGNSDFGLVVRIIEGIRILLVSLA